VCSKTESKLIICRKVEAYVMYQGPQSNFFTMKTYIVIPDVLMSVNHLYKSSTSLLFLADLLFLLRVLETKCFNTNLYLLRRSTHYMVWLWSFRNDFIARFKGSHATLSQ